ncbi:uncharacterized protein LOC128092678 [Culex pipiens pallens]|uniref:uncharacterized protein LOC128092678 n=1 Tax=Culex pipiens pallens TaxID=42434 RepID=UPI0022AA61BB|nr:uncharacterized protein LOC128092678 [Culex pipiens pallens]
MILDAKQSRPRQQPGLGRGNLREPNSSSGTPSKEGGAGAGRGRVLEKDKASFLQELLLFHGRDAMRGRNVDSHRWTTKSYIIGGGQRRCCTRCRRFSRNFPPTNTHVATAQLQPNESGQ